MFRSYEYGYADGRHYKIVDDDFTAYIGTQHKYVFDVLIEEYEKRGLPVASNLVLAMQYCVRLNPRDSILYRLPYWKCGNKLLVKYENELSKYLLLL